VIKVLLTCLRLIIILSGSIYTLVAVENASRFIKGIRLFLKKYEDTDAKSRF
jgi:hypothetical protein